MKAIVFLGDGMADYPVPELNHKTPLMAAKTPAMDLIAKNGQTGLFKTIEDDMATGSAVANLSVLGYDPHVCFEGRGVLEAASLGVDLEESDLAMRVNLICAEEGKIKSHSAGHISDDEAAVLISDLQAHFADWPIRLTQGLSYRHLLVVPEGNAGLLCIPPHDYVGAAIADHLVKATSQDAEQTAQLLNRMIEESARFLKNHPVNAQREAAGKQAANMLWPWSPGHKPRMQTFHERFGVSGAVISAVDLIKGLGVYAGLEVIDVPGATGLYDTNYEGKADACLDALKRHDFVYVHVEAPDEAGHEKNLKLKIQCIEDLDQRLIQRVLNGISSIDDFVIGLLPDHPTPVATGTHVRDAVPVAIWDSAKSPDTVCCFDEESVKNGELGMLRGNDFMSTVFRRSKNY